MYGTKETPQKRAVKADDSFDGKNLNNIKINNSNTSSNAIADQSVMNTNLISIVGVQQESQTSSSSSSSIFNILQDQRNRKSTLFSNPITTTNSYVNQQTSDTFYSKNDENDEFFTSLDYKKKISNKFNYDIFKYKPTIAFTSAIPTTTKPTTASTTTSNMKNYNQRYDYYSGGSEDVTVDDEEDQDLENYHETNSNNYNDLDYEAKDNINYDNSDYILNGEDKGAIKDTKLSSSVTLKTKLRPSVKQGESVVPFKALSNEFQLNNERSSVSEYSTSFSLSYLRMYKFSNFFLLVIFLQFNFNFENVLNFFL